ncbi:MAG: hypothetical protein ACHQM4_10525 [Thermoanaerobaculia bacterium]
MKNNKRIAALLVAGVSLAILSSAPAFAKDKCKVKAVLGGKPVTMTHCAAAVYDDQHSVTLYFSDTLFTPDELSAFHVSSYAVDKTADGKPRTMMHFAFCPGAGKPAASAGAVKSVETSANLAGAFLTGRQWRFELPRDKEMLTVEKLTGDVVPGGKLSGRITGGKMSDGLKYSWEADFDFTLPAKSASAGIGGCRD